MAYTKTTWVNDQTELNAQNMNHIEDGIANTQNVQLIAVSEEAPSECQVNDKYYNITDNLIYTATDTDTWSEDGEEPIYDILYIILEEKTTYTYNGETLISVGGGGGGGITVAPDEPTEDTKLYIESMDLDAQYEVNEDKYSTNETLTNKIWIDGKPIYSKTIIVNRTSGSSLSYHITFDSTGNVNTIINVIGIAKKGNMAWPFYRVNDNDQYRYYIYNYSKGDIEVSTGSNFPGDTHTANITMYYTKTTD